MTEFIHLHSHTRNYAPTSVNPYTLNLGFENMLIEGYTSMSQE